MKRSKESTTTRSFSLTEQAFAAISAYAKQEQVTHSRAASELLLLGWKAHAKSDE